MEKYRIIDIIEDKKYKVFLSVAVKYSDAFSLTTFKSVHKKHLKDSYFETLEFLLPYSVEDISEYSLPRHYEKGQKFHVYSLTSDSTQVLGKTDGIYLWRLPDFPEDLCFYRHKKVWLSTVSHEKLCFLHDIPQNVLSDFQKEGFTIIQL
ncbi:MAG: hypothetical protein IJL87_04565 [Clostridia bacterium]|nr:hypothetical protein [Clostridia bacterium]